MRLVTIASLGASAVLGLGALFVAKIALPNAAQAKNPAADRVVEGVPVVVASRAVKYGEKLEAGMLTVIKAPANAVPEGAFSTVAAALAADRGAAPVALVSMSQREAVLTTKISGPGERPSISASVAPGFRAYAVKINDATGVGGHALPGDHVDVVLMRDLTPDGPQRSYISYVVVQNARVLGQDLNNDPTSNKPQDPNTATLEVTIEDSQKLAVAATLGTLSLALRKNGEVNITTAGPMRTGDFLVGGGARSNAPGRIVSRGVSRTYSAILIVEGEPSKRGGGRSRAPRGSGGSATQPGPAVSGAAGAANPLAGSAALGAIG